MVTWVGDGLVAGYSPETNQLEDDTYHLATTGSIDLNAITRLQYRLPDGVDTDTHPNRLTIHATLNFDAADFAAHPGSTSGSVKGLMAGAFYVKASKFPSDTIPTAKQILDIGYQNLGWWRSNLMAHVTGAHTYKMDGWGPGYLEPNTKYWLLVMPVFHNGNLDPPIRAMNNVTPNSVGRVISFWSNRRPAVPTITSPPSGTQVAANSTVLFKYQPNDADASGTADRYDRDLAGFQLAYAELPTPENPNPTWHTPIFKGTGSHLYNAHVYMNQADVTSGDIRISMLRNLGMPIQIGGRLDDAPEGSVWLPAGQWQLRCRVADYGNPYPTLPNSSSGKYLGFTSINQVPESNISDWCEPIRVGAFQQVPPPIALSARDEIAIADTSVTRLSYQYRNTYDPPFDQYSRTYQIRKVGEEFWHTIVDTQVTTSTSLDLPAGFTFDTPPDPIPADAEQIVDGGFETGGFSGWQVDPSSGAGITRDNFTGLPGFDTHSGTHAIRLVGTSDFGFAGLYYNADCSIEFPEDFNHIEFTAWYQPNADIGQIVVAASWVDSSGDPLTGGLGSPVNGTGYSEYIYPPLSGWADFGENYRKVTFEMDKPPGAVYLQVSVLSFTAASIAGDFGDPNAFEPGDGWPALDDTSIVGSYIDRGEFKLEATTEYEWRVRVDDASLSDDSHSDWSERARFWIVPGAGSGVVKPLPESTIDGATLGCGTHRVFVYRRGGKVRVGEIRGISHVDWNRRRDEISDAKIVVTDWDVDCGNLLANLQTWAYEIVIFRDNGYSVDRVWEGPISLLTYEYDAVTIQAKDVMNYAYRRIIRQAMNDSGKTSTNPTAGRTVVARATQIVQNVLAPDDPNVLAYLTPIVNGSDAKQYRSTPAFSRTAYEEIDDMAANAGLDYTVVGRAILLWGTKSRIGTLPEFRDEDLGSKPIVSEYGMSFANFYSVSDGNGVHGDASRLDVSGNDPIYGRVEMLSSTWASDSEEDTGTYTQAGLATLVQSFTEYAERSISDRYPPPVVVRVPDNTTLNSSAVISIQHLVPGAVVPLRSTGTLRTVVSDQKLDSVSVTEESGNESITITLSPFSGTDSAELGGEEG